MANEFFLEIIVPDRKFFSDSVEAINLRTPGGEIGVLGGHMPMVVAVDIGPIRIRKNGKWLDAFLSEGYMEILKDKAIIIADTAEWPEEIDINRAKAAEERARERLRNKLSRMEYLQSQAALRRALTRLQITSHK
jgi:F-type H+-transporting ATPase subunit epsilon